MMSKPIKQLMVTTPQGGAGALHHEARFSFNYAAGAREAQVSLVMPMRAQSYSSPELPGVFAMNRPEGEPLRRLTSKFAKLGSLGDMQLLALTGDNQIGRLGYAVPGGERRAVRPPPIGLTALLKHPASTELFDFLVETTGEAGISGVQPKVMIADGDKVGPANGKPAALHSSLIVKLGGHEQPLLAQNEFLCMQAARASSICVPQLWLSDSGRLFVVERFDLQEGKSWGFEDMAVLQGKLPDTRGDYKYQGSYEGIARAIQLFCRDRAIESQQRLFDYVALSVMVRNGDAHLKNFGLLYEHPLADQPPSLAPLYDVVTTTAPLHTHPRTGVAKADPLMALKMHKDKRYPTRETLLRFGADTCHVARPQEVIERIGTAMQETLHKHRERIDEKLFKLMRAQWDAGRLSVAPAQHFMARNQTNTGAEFV